MEEKCLSDENCKVPLNYSKVMGLDVMVIEFRKDQAAHLNCARSKFQKEGRMATEEL